MNNDCPIDFDTAFYDVIFNEQLKQIETEKFEQQLIRNIEVILQHPESSLTQLPTLPHALLELLGELNNVNATFESIAVIIAREPVLTTKILSIANSPRFSANEGKIQSIDKAVMVLGLEEISEITTAILFDKALRVDSNHYHKFGKIIWQHSLQTAFIAYDLGGQCDLPPFLCYLIGLIHDIGKIFIFNLISKELSKSSPHYLPSSKLFIQTMTKYSEHLSFIIAQYWQLPRPIVQALTVRSTLPLHQVLFQANRISEGYMMVDNQLVTEEVCIDGLAALGINREYLLAFWQIAPTIKNEYL